MPDISIPQARSAKKSRSKKLKSELGAGATCGVPDATASTTPKLTTTEVEGAAQNYRGSGKKKRRSGNRDEDDDEKLVAQGNNQSFKEKEKKKRKRKSEGQTASTSVGEWDPFMICVRVYCAFEDYCNTSNRALLCLTQSLSGPSEDIHRYISACVHEIRPINRSLVRLIFSGPNAKSNRPCNRAGRILYHWTCLELGTQPITHLTFRRRFFKLV